MIEARRARATGHAHPVLEIAFPRSGILGFGIRSRM